MGPNGAAKCVKGKIAMFGSSVLWIIKTSVLLSTFYCVNAKSSFGIIKLLVNYNSWWNDGIDALYGLAILREAILFAIKISESILFAITNYCGLELSRVFQTWKPSFDFTSPSFSFLF